MNDQQTIYLVEINHVLQKEVFTTLKGVCEYANVNYSTFSRTKSEDHTHITRTGEVVRIVTANLNKVKGRSLNVRRIKG